MTQAGQAVNQTCCAGSPQAQVMVAEVAAPDVPPEDHARDRERRLSRVGGGARDAPADRTATSPHGRHGARSPRPARRAFSPLHQERIAAPAGPGSRERAVPWPRLPAGRRMVKTSSRFRNIGAVPETVDKDGLDKDGLDKRIAALTTVGTSSSAPNCVVVGAGLSGSRRHGRWCGGARPSSCSRREKGWASAVGVQRRRPDLSAGLPPTPLRGDGLPRPAPVDRA